MTSTDDLDAGSGAITDRSAVPSGAIAIAAALGVLAAGLYAAFLEAAWPFTVDDAYITFRYSQNLALGHGPRFNPGLAPAEGYTTFLWMIVMTLPHLMSIDAPFAAKLISVICTVGCVGVASRMAYRWVLFGSQDEATSRGAGWIAAALCAFLLASFRPLALHSVSGMETALFMLWLVLFFERLVLAHDDPTPKQLGRLALFGLLVGLTRPEGNLVVGIGLATLFLGFDRRARRTLVRAFVLIHVLPGTAYFIWRFGYYGALLPLPFYVGGLFGSARPGVDVVLSFASWIGSSVGPFVLLGALRTGPRSLPPLVAAASLIIFYLFPVHRMAYGYRYLFPVVPLFAALSAVGVHQCVAWVGARTPQNLSRVAPVLTFIVCVAWMLAMHHPDVFQRGFAGSLAQVRGFADTYKRGMNRGHIRLGRELRALRPNGDAVLAIADAGAVPYYSRWRTVDTFGLNEAHVALTNDRSPAYILSQRPDLLVLLSYRHEHFSPVLPWTQDLMDAAVASGMELIGKRRALAYGLWLFADPDGPVAEGLRKSEPNRQNPQSQPEPKPLTADDLRIEPGLEN